MPELTLATQAVACALCGAENHRPVCWNDSLRIVQCTGCGMVFVNPQPTQSALLEYYAAQDLMEQDGWSSYFRHRPEQIHELWQRRFADMQRWKNGPGVRLLDVGSGCGDFLHQALQAGWEVRGFEFSPAVAEVSRRKYGIAVEVSVIFDLRDHDNSFDAVAMWHVLEHMRDPLGALRRCRELLAPGGLLALEVPNLNFLARKSYRYPLSLNLHLYHFSPATLSGIVRKAGFEVLECRRGHTGYLYRSKAKIYAKKCLYGISQQAEKLLGINMSDSIRLYAAKSRSRV